MTAKALSPCPSCGQDGCCPCAIIKDKMEQKIKAKAKIGDYAHQRTHQGKATEGIYSTEIFTEAAACVVSFASFALAKNPKAETINDCRPHIGAYFQKVVSEGLPPQEALSRIAGTLSKVYDCTREEIYKDIREQVSPTRR